MKKPPSSSSSSIPEPDSPLWRVFHNAYPCHQKGKSGELAKNRDAAAFVELMAALTLHGYTFESIIFNYALVDGIPVREEFILIRSGDLIVMVTRPPMHDTVRKIKKKFLRSGTRMEFRIFDVMSRYLSVCSRVHLRLGEEIVSAWERGRGLLPGGGLQTPADFKFGQNCDARLKSWRTLDPKARARRFDQGPEDYRSIGCFLHVPRIEEFDCRLIVSFGMGSFENLVWNRIVRTRFDRWIDRPVFAIAEMDLNGLPEDPVTLQFADQIPVNVLLEVPLEEGEGEAA